MSVDLVLERTARGVSLRRGRDFSDFDGSDAPLVANPARTQRAE